MEACKGRRANTGIVDLTRSLKWGCWHYEDVLRITPFSFIIFPFGKFGGNRDLLDENEQFLNIMYDKITTCPGCSLEIHEMGKDMDQKGERRFK
jgi:hypothetical protein